MIFKYSVELITYNKMQKFFKKNHIYIYGILWYLFQRFYYYKIVIFVRDYFWNNTSCGQSPEDFVGFSYPPCIRLVENFLIVFGNSVGYTFIVFYIVYSLKRFNKKYHKFNTIITYLLYIPLVLWWVFFLGSFTIEFFER